MRIVPTLIDGSSANISDSSVAIVVSKYNHNITNKLLDGAVECLMESGIEDPNIHIAWVPGAWEIPVVADRFARSKKFDAVVTLGAVIKGETSHDQHINQQVSQSLGRISLETAVPVLFGVLTCNSLEQAIHRSGGNMGNKGAECATAAIEMIRLLREMDKSNS